MSHAGAVWCLIYLFDMALAHLSLVCVGVCECGGVGGGWLVVEQWGFCEQVELLVATYLRTGIDKLSTLRDKLETS